MAQTPIRFPEPNYPQLWNVQKPLTASYTILASDFGTLFTNDGAAAPITLFLPPLSATPFVFGLLITSDQTVTLQASGSDGIISPTKKTTSALSFATAGQRVGVYLKVYSNADNTFWLVEHHHQLQAVTVDGNVVGSLGRTEISAKASRFGSGIPISSRCMWTGPNGVTTANWSVANTPATYRQRHPLVYDACNLRLVYFGYGQSGQSGHDGEENPNNTVGAEVFTTLTITAGIECRVTGTGGNITYPVYFRGQRTGTLDPGGILVSDPLGIQLEGATQNFFYTRTFVTTANQFPLGVTPLGANNEGTDTGGDKTGYNNATGAFVAGNTMFGPWLVLGETSPASRVVVGCIGDSIITGAKNNQKDGSTINTTTIDLSFLDNAINNTLPIVKLSRTAEVAAGFSSTRLTQGRHAAMGCCTHIVVDYGRNDLANAVAAATIYSQLQAMCRFIHTLGAKAYLCTIFPETTSTDNWATVSNQTVTSHEAARLTLNASIRGAVADGTADGVFDVCSVVEVNSSGVLTQGGGFWISNGVAKHYTSDGIHPSFDGNILVATTINPAVFVI